MKKYIVASSDGINWMSYHILELDLEIGTCSEIDHWRAHRFENRGYHATTEYRIEFFKNNCDILSWNADGKPGGISGLKENYRKPSAARLSIKGKNADALFRLI